MLAEGQVGGVPGTALKDRVTAIHRFGRHGQLIVSDGHGHFYEPTVRGQIFYAHSAAAGTASVATIGTMAMFCLYNPKGTKVNLSVLWGGITLRQATLPSGFFSWCTNTNLDDAVPTGTAITSYPGFVGGAASQGVALATATVVAPNPIRTIGSTLPVTILTANNPFQISDLVDGAIVLPPGGAVSIQGVQSTAVAASLIFSVMWAEEPV